MQTIIILSQKGGTGKTTLALHLAVAAEKNGVAMRAEGNGLTLNALVAKNPAAAVED